MISDEYELAELNNLSVSSSLEEILEGFKLHPSFTKIVKNLSSDEIFFFRKLLKLR